MGVETPISMISLETANRTTISAFFRNDLTATGRTGPSQPVMGFTDTDPFLKLVH
jgi:hypothetical protein